MIPYLCNIINKSTFNGQINNNYYYGYMAIYITYLCIVSPQFISLLYIVYYSNI